MVLQIQNILYIKIKNMCIIKLGNIVAGLIDVITLGHGKSMAGWIAWNIYRRTDCGCEARRIAMNQWLGCKEGIKL
jgi:hypothetical protein